MEYPTISHALLDLRHRVLHRGERVAPRGLGTTELRGLSFSITDAVDYGAPVKIGRKLAGKLAAIEGAQNLAGKSFPDIAIAVSPHLEQYAERDVDGNPFFHGAYGPRLAVQLRSAEHQIRRDSATRQAVVSLWKEEDRWPQWADRPCATEFQFLLRRNSLEMFVYMRSNDLWKGFCYDVFQFAQLQALLAHILGTDVGPYHHYAASMHVYDADVERLEALRLEPSIDPRADTFRWGPDWKSLPAQTYAHVGDAQISFRAMFECIRAGLPFRPDNIVEEWYYERLGGVL